MDDAFVDQTVEAAAQANAAVGDIEDASQGEWVFRQVLLPVVANQQDDGSDDGGSDDGGSEGSAFEDGANEDGANEDGASEDSGFVDGDGEDGADRQGGADQQGGADHQGGAEHQDGAEQQGGVDQQGDGDQEDDQQADNGNLVVAAVPVPGPRLADLTRPAIERIINRQVGELPAPLSQKDIYEHELLFRFLSLANYEHDNEYALACAGWSGTDYKNVIYCATCLLFAQDVEGSDNPLTLHALLSPACEFVRNVKITEAEKNSDETKEMLERCWRQTLEF